MFLNNWLNNCPRCVTSSLLLLLSAVTAEGQRVLSWSSACRTSNRYTGQINTKTASWDRFWGQDRGIIIQGPYGIAWHKMYHVKRQRQKIDKTAKRQRQRQKWHFWECCLGIKILKYQTKMRKFTGITVWSLVIKMCGTVISLDKTW